ncbi:MAG TPA: hypothetical protein VFD60_03490, partial [Nitrososphaeraceae archaeon]|nr:hypothetical protein [Nitrososphaeraceae archaeon]
MIKYYPTGYIIVIPVLVTTRNANSFVIIVLVSLFIWLHPNDPEFIFNTFYSTTNISTLSIQIVEERIEL